MTIRTRNANPAKDPTAKPAIPPAVRPELPELVELAVVSGDAGVAVRLELVALDVISEAIPGNTVFVVDSVAEDAAMAVGMLTIGPPSVADGQTVKVPATVPHTSWTSGV